MTSERMLKLTIVLLVAFAATHVALNKTLDGMDEDELTAMAADQDRMLEHPAVIAVCVADRLALVAAVVSAAMTAVLWLRGA